MKKTIRLIFSIMIFILILSGCSKDSILKTYDHIIEKGGNNILTNDRELVGERNFGKDHYVGTYKAEYNKFNKEEVLFGGATKERMAVQLKLR